MDMFLIKSCKMKEMFFYNDIKDEWVCCNWKVVIQIKVIEYCYDIL